MIRTMNAGSMNDFHPLWRETVPNRNQYGVQPELIPEEFRCVHEAQRIVNHETGVPAKSGWSSEYIE